MSSDNEDDFNFLASQQSNGSDDQALELALKKHYAAIREKKRKEQEKKFLKVAHKQFYKDATALTDQVKSSVTALEALYTDFIHRYATNEDVIYKLWGGIQQEQQRLLTLGKKIYALDAETGKKMEAGHTSGLARVKTACREFQEIINQIAPQDE